MHAWKHMFLCVSPFPTRSPYVFVCFLTLPRVVLFAENGEALPTLNGTGKCEVRLISESSKQERRGSGFVRGFPLYTKGRCLFRERTVPRKAKRLLSNKTPKYKGIKTYTCISPFFQRSQPACVAGAFLFFLWR